MGKMEGSFIAMAAAIAVIYAFLPTSRNLSYGSNSNWGIKLQSIKILVAMLPMTVEEFKWPCESNNSRIVKSI